MIKRIFTNTIIVSIIAVSLFFAGNARQPDVVNADATSLSTFAGIVAFTQIAPVDLEIVKPAFQMIEYETASYFVGTLDLPIYETVYDPLVLVTADGFIIAFYPNTDPAGKIVDVISKNLDETLLEKAVGIVADTTGAIGYSVSHYDFGNPLATKMLLVSHIELSISSMQYS